MTTHVQPTYMTTLDRYVWIEKVHRKMCIAYKIRCINTHDTCPLICTVAAMLISEDGQHYTMDEEDIHDVLIHTTASVCNNALVGLLVSCIGPL
jgi:hypothetical protein